MYSLSRRVLIMLTGSVLISLLVAVTIYGLYGAPTTQQVSVAVADRADDPLDDREAPFFGHDTSSEREYELKQVHVVSRTMKSLETFVKRETCHRTH